MSYKSYGHFSLISSADINILHCIMLIKFSTFTFYLININFVKVLNKIVEDYAEH